jgi:histidinol-phosphatase (PHP family)
MTDFHIHTTFSDGENTPEEVVLTAIKMGMEKIGFSDHSYTPFDSGYCMAPVVYDDYKAEIYRLRDKYHDKIEILCGIEQDYFSEIIPEGFDYIIGSVHYLKLGDEYIPVDDEAHFLREAAEKYFGGDALSLAEEYFKTVAKVAERTKCNIIGHFDLITKLCEVDPIFDETHPRYIAAYKAAVDELIKYDIPFEINFGAISRGYRTTPYPAPQIRDYIKEKGGRFILSSDSHAAKTICFKFEDFKL